MTLGQDQSQTQYLYNEHMVSQIQTFMKKFNPAKLSNNKDMWPYSRM